MKRLNNKVFYTILSILTLSIISFIIVFNIQNYLQEKHGIENALKVSMDEKKDFFPRPENSFNDKNIRFMDQIVYEIIFKDNEIDEIINRSNNNISDSEIKKIVDSIIEDNKKMNIGNLYFSSYSYEFTNDNRLIIVDNINVRKKLINNLEISLIIFVIIEIIVIIICKKLTNWIIKPVENSFKKQKEFIADASHELKTPLSVIISSSEALEDNPNETKWLKNIQNESERMNKLITNLLELARSEKENLTLTRMNLSKVIELSVLTFEAKAFEKNLSLKADIDENIYCDINEDAIKQVLEILLDNAIKHSYNKKTINVKLVNNKNIELYVENYGDPIPKGEEEKIFERFYRVDKSRNRKENRYGLGLAIAKNIIENHNGTIMAYSNDGKTTFKVLLKK